MTAEEFLIENDKLVYKAFHSLFAGINASGIHDRLRYQGFEVEDIVQEGRVAMFEAYNNYVESKGAKLTTYAYQHARFMMMRYLNNNHIVRFPRGNDSKKEVEERKKVIMGMKWLDKPVENGDNEDVSLLDIVADEYYEFEDNDFIFDVAEAMNVLTDQQKEMFVKRFVEDKMLKDIAKDYKVSSERVRQICENSSFKIKKILEGKFVSGFYSLQKDGAA